MDNPTLIIVLALATLVIVIGYLMRERFAVKKAQETHEHSALTAGHPEQRD